jgi:hypothetical protein
MKCHENNKNKNIFLTCFNIEPATVKQIKNRAGRRNDKTGLK